MPTAIATPIDTIAPTGAPRHLFVASLKTQGQRKNDLFSCEEGEIVILPYRQCPNAAVDDACGCARTLEGIRSHGKTITMEVIVCPYGASLIRAGIRQSLKTNGQWEKIQHDMDPEEYLSSLVDGLFQEAGEFAIGDIVEYRGTYEKRISVNVPS